jgi:hypothetical protein
MNYEDALPIREYARMNNVSEGNIRKLRNNGKIPPQAFVTNPKNKRPLIIPSIADEAWGKLHRDKKNITASPSSKTKRTQSINIVQVPMDNPLPIQSDNDTPPDTETIIDDNGMPIITVNMSIHQADKANKILEAMTRKVKLRKMNGELVEVSSVHQALFLYGQVIRAELQNIPERIIDDLLAVTNRNKGYQLLSSAIDKALEKLSTPPKIS